MSYKNPTKLIVTLVTVCCLAFAFLSPTRAYALDKRLRLAMKTGGYGAAAGLVIGAGTMAMGLGGFRNVLMGTSSGLYAGLLLAAFVIATPSFDDDARDHKGGRRNPYAPRKPVGPDDYEEDEDGFKEHLPPRSDDSSQNFTPDLRLRSGAGPEDLARIEQARHGQRELGIWTPLLSLQW